VNQRDRPGRVYWSKDDRTAEPSFIIAPPVQTYLFAEGFWGYLNHELHTIFGEYEADPIGPELAKRMAEFLRGEGARWAEERSAGSDVSTTLAELADYLDAAAQANTTAWTDF
jgi:hypothetical protein